MTNETLQSEDDRQWVFVVLDENNEPLLDEHGEPVFRVVPKPGRQIEPPAINVTMATSTRRLALVAAAAGAGVSVILDAISRLL